MASSDKRFILSAAMKTHVAVFWVMTPCIDVVGYQHLGKPCCLHLQGEVKVEGCQCTASQPRRTRLAVLIV
jgi:hypothetical protein